MMIKNNLDKLKNNPGVQKYLANTSWLFLEKIIRMTAGLLIGVMVARYLGPKQFGFFSYLISFVGLFTVIATLGLDSIVVRELVKKKSQANMLLGTAFTLKFFAAIIVITLILLTANFTGEDSTTTYYILLIASSTLFQSTNVVDFYFQSQVSSKYIAYVNIISLVISSIVKIILVISEAPLTAFVWMTLFDSISLACAFCYFYSTKASSLLAWRFKRTIALRLLKDSWPLILSGIMISLYMRIDQVMIKNMLDDEAVGFYSAAIRLSEVWYFIPMLITSSLFPAIVNAKKHSVELYHSRLQKLYDLTFWGGVLIALPISLMSEWIVLLVFGDAYHEAASVLVLHVWAGIFVGMGVVKGKWQVAENLPMHGFYGAILSLVVNLILNYLLIPQYGIKGAAFATLVSQLCAGYLINYFFKELHPQLRLIHNSLNFKRLFNVSNSRNK
ncbi:MAG: O-antigen/teichoic acid export membrane protein [Francisellaceae bacterium]|jgi:O-antigen/teichoic acid export membrane protein